MGNMLNSKYHSLGLRRALANLGDSAIERFPPLVGNFPPKDAQTVMQMNKDTTYVLTYVIVT